MKGFFVNVFVVVFLRVVFFSLFDVFFQGWFVLREVCFSGDFLGFTR